MGNTSYNDSAGPLFLITRRNDREVSIKDGAISENGSIWGTYVHGIFDNDGFRRGLIE